MIIEGCARGVVLLLLVSSSFSRGFDDTSKTLDASVHDATLTSAPKDEVERQNAASIRDKQRIDEGGAGGGNTTSDGKESKQIFGSFQGQFQVAAGPLATNNTSICLLLAANAGIRSPTALQTYLQQCAALLGLIAAPTTTAVPAITPPVTGICQFLAASAGITSPTALQTYLQQCAVLLGLITAPSTTAPTTTAPTTTAAPTITPPVTGVCQLLAANAGITSPIALQTYLQQCAVLLGLITAPTTTAPTTTAPTTTAAPTIPAAVTGICLQLAANAGVTSPIALQAYLQQCAALIG